uniref:Uncharacterized protein n=1 Tax=Anguilla anguilla TaxID=7936 RepID=A0A0E9WR42_ANGAN
MGSLSTKQIHLHSWKWRMKIQSMFFSSRQEASFKSIKSPPPPLHTHTPRFQILSLSNCYCHCRICTILKKTFSVSHKYCCIVFSSLLFSFLFVHKPQLADCIHLVILK